MNKSLDALNDDLVTFGGSKFQNSPKSVMLGEVRVKKKLDKSRNRYENAKSNESLSGALQKSNESLENPSDVLNLKPNKKVSFPDILK